MCIYFREMLWTAKNGLITTEEAGSRMLAPSPSCLPYNIRTACLRLLVFAKPRTVFQTQRPSPMGSEVSGETDSEQWITEPQQWGTQGRVQAVQNDCHLERTAYLGSYSILFRSLQKQILSWIYWALLLRFAFIGDLEKRLSEQGGLHVERVYCTARVPITFQLFCYLQHTTSKQMPAAQPSCWHAAVPCATKDNSWQPQEMLSLDLGASAITNHALQEEAQQQKTQGTACTRPSGPWREEAFQIWKRTQRTHKVHSGGFG